MPFFSDIDWDTQPANASLADHWRVFMGMLIGTLLTTVILHVAFPNTFWFMKFWSGHAIGVTVGAIAAMQWQIYNDDRRRRTSGLLLCTVIGSGGLFAAIALSGAVPDMASQEATLKSVRSLADPDVVSLSIQEQGRNTYQIDSRDVIADFVAHMERATLFYPSHEGSVAELELTIHFRNGASATYAARIPEKHPSDMSLLFKGYTAYCEVLLPGGRSWLQIARTTQTANNP